MILLYLIENVILQMFIFYYIIFEKSNISVEKFHQRFYLPVHRGYSDRNHSALQLRRKTRTYLRHIIINAQASIQEVHVNLKHLIVAHV